MAFEGEFGLIELIIVVVVKIKGKKKKKKTTAKNLKKKI